MSSTPGLKTMMAAVTGLTPTPAGDTPAGDTPAPTPPSTSTKPPPTGSKKKSRGSLGSTGSAAADPEEKSFLATYWWVGAALAAVIGVILLIIKFWPTSEVQQDSPGGQQPPADPKRTQTVGQECSDSKKCNQGKCTEGKCEWVGRGHDCSENFHCEDDICQEEAEGKKTCRVKLNGECKHHNQCEDDTVCSDAVTPQRCKAVIGGTCKQEDDCYQKLNALTGSDVAASASDLLAKMAKSTKDILASFWKNVQNFGMKASEPEQALKKELADEAKEAMVKRFESADGNNKFPLLSCQSESSTCQVFAGHMPVPASFLTGEDPHKNPYYQCSAVGKQTVKDVGLPKDYLCKAKEGEKCGSPRGQPMNAWCDSNKCEKSSGSDQYTCQAAQAPAQIQLGESADAWLFTNASLSETRAHAGTASNLRGKRTRSPDASALQVDPF